MAMVRLKIMSSGRIPGFPGCGPVLNPIIVDEKVAMRFINAGLDVRIWNDQINQFVKFSARDMLDFYNKKNYIGFSGDSDHNQEGDDCLICDEVPNDVNDLIELTRVKTTPTLAQSTTTTVSHKRIGSNDPIVHVLEERPEQNITEADIYYEEDVYKEDFYDDIPDFGDAYEPAPVKKTNKAALFDAFGLDDFEEK